MLVGEHLLVLNRTIKKIKLSISFKAEEAETAPKKEWFLQQDPVSGVQSRILCM